MTENQRDSEVQILVDTGVDQVLPVDSPESKQVSDDNAIPEFDQNSGEFSDATGLESNDQLIELPTEEVEGSAVPDLGELLRSERVRQGLSLAEVARRLCLSEQQVTAIESPTHTSVPLPNPTFLRGYVRNYARILRLTNTDQLLKMLPDSPAQMYSGGNLVRSMQPIQSFSSYSHNSGKKWLYSLLVIGLVLTGYVLFESDKLEQESSALLGDLSLSIPSGGNYADKQMAIELPLPTVTPPSSFLPAEVPPMLPPVTSTDHVKDALAGVKPPADGLSKSSVKTEDLEGIRSLHFVFSRDSWVKVKDSEGKVILEKIHARDSEHTISGKPPLYLVIGNAAGVRLTSNGREVDLAPYTRGNDDVARFSLE